MPSEFELISRLAKRLPAPRRAGTVGIGDDCAALPLPGGGYQLLTCDIAVAGRHFTPGLTPMQAVGWRVATASASDVAACGGRPEAALISLGVPRGVADADLDALYDGLAEAAAAYGFDAVGGNVSGSAELFVDLFMQGRCERFVSRAGAKPGDLILLSGPTGQEEAGREALAAGEAPQHPLAQCHLRPMARVDLAPRVAQAASACIDISDGLASELQHLAQASSACLAVSSAALPITPALAAWAEAQGRTPLDWVLGGGEGYQLLFTLPPTQRETYERLGCVVIGDVQAGQGVLLDGQPLTATGWDHLLPRS